MTPIDVLCLLLEQNGCGGFVREHTFSETRRFRLDIAYLIEGYAIELDGAVWANGRHNRGSGYIKDCEKLNYAIMCGWKVLRYTTDDLEKRPAYIVAQVKQALGRGT